MTWRDNSSSSNRSSTDDGSGGSMRAGGEVRGTGGGGGWGGGRDKGGSMYTYRKMGQGKKQGNWNTGGAITGFGSLGGGIMPVSGPTKHIGVPQPASAPIGPMVQPPAPPIAQPAIAGIPGTPTYPQPGQVTDVFGQPVRMDPGILHQMMNGMNPKDQSRLTGGASYPGQQPSYSSMGDPYSRGWGLGQQNKAYGNDMFGASLGGGFQQNNKLGRVGGGRGGGGGGGW